MPNTLFNTRTTQMATSNPQTNVNQVNNQVQQPVQNNNTQAPQVQNGQAINPITIPIQFQPQIASNQAQTINNNQPNSNLQVISGNQSQEYNAPTPQQYQGNNQNNNTIDFNQIYDSYQNNFVSVFLSFFNYELIANYK